MNNKLCTFFFLFYLLSINGQSIDTIALVKTQNKISYKQFVAPVTLIAMGSILLKSKLNTDLQSNAQRLFGSDFHTGIDNLMLAVPAGQIYLGKYLGFKPRNDFQHQTINLVVANAIMVGVVYAMKYTFKEERPDHSDNLSFPSGHSATAFTNASLLFYEYKDSNLAYASSGFLFATATGILRIANNKHYTSDVVTGAGIGLATGLLVSYWSPFQTMTFGKKKKSTAFVYPQIGNQIGIGAFVRLD